MKFKDYIFVKTQLDMNGVMLVVEYIIHQYTTKGNLSVLLGLSRLIAPELTPQCYDDFE